MHIVSRRTLFPSQNSDWSSPFTNNKLSKTQERFSITAKYALDTIIPSKIAFKITPYINQKTWINRRKLNMMYRISNDFIALQQIYWAFQYMKCQCIKYEKKRIVLCSLPH